MVSIITVGETIIILFISLHMIFVVRYFSTIFSLIRLFLAINE